MIIEYFKGVLNVWCLAGIILAFVLMSWGSFGGRTISLTTGMFIGVLLFILYRWLVFKV